MYICQTQDLNFIENCLPVALSLSLAGPKTSEIQETKLYTNCYSNHFLFERNIFYIYIFLMPVKMLYHFYNSFK